MLLISWDSKFSFWYEKKKNGAIGIGLGFLMLVIVNKDKVYIVED